MRISSEEAWDELWGEIIDEEDPLDGASEEDEDEEEAPHDIIIVIAGISKRIFFIDITSRNWSRRSPFRESQVPPFCLLQGIS